MLKFDREYNDGRFYFLAHPLERGVNRVTVEDRMEGKTLKQFFTVDDEAAIGLFETMILCLNERGPEELARYDFKAALPGNLSNKIENEM